MWKELSDPNQLEILISDSSVKPQVIFKHSTRCNTSSVTKNRIERGFDSNNSLDFYLLDLIKHRNISHKVADIFKVYHESPQILLIKNGECVYDESHLAINVDEITEQAFSS
ncbi:MAG: bacillithiol system redox-active protein YtxJ [Sphingobacteriales bacterium]|nr:bacillithiol system redox-active protein YtxJ [Sphingobacteriales bacterium]